LKTGILYLQIVEIDSSLWGAHSSQWQLRRYTIEQFEATKRSNFQSFLSLYTRKFCKFVLLFLYESFVVCYTKRMDAILIERTWLMILGIVLIFLELLMGAASGFDVALVGFSLVAGGLVHFYSRSWEYGVISAIVIIVLYFILFRSSIRKKLLITTQKIGIDSLIGKTAVTTSAISAKKAGSVVVDGEVWRAVSLHAVAENTPVEVISIEGVSLTVVPMEQK